MNKRVTEDKGKIKQMERQEGGLKKDFDLGPLGIHTCWSKYPVARDDFDSYTIETMWLAVVNQLHLTKDLHKVLLVRLVQLSLMNPICGNNQDKNETETRSGYAPFFNRKTGEDTPRCFQNTETKTCWF